MFFNKAKHSTNSFTSKPTTPPKDGDEYVKAVGIAGKVFQLVEEHLTPPCPPAYHLWYRYVEGENRELNRRVNEAIKQQGKLSQYDITQLHDELFGCDRQNNATRQKAAEDLSKECASFIGLLSDQINLNDGFADSLVSANKKLNNNPSVENLRDVVLTLVAENKNMKSQTSVLQKKLHKSQHQLKKLTSDLTKIRKNELTDPLTQVGNRRCFDEILKNNITAAAKGNRPFCLVLLDLDHFKRVNDNFGHLVGDAILKVVANLMKKNTKGRDTSARYGGEEFAIIMPDTVLSDARKIADQIRTELETQQLEVTQNGTPIGTITASFGVSQYRRGDTPQTIIARADKKLYEAKNDGRNRVAA